MSRLARHQQIALGGGVALLIISFLPWYGIPGYSINAWDAEFWAWGGVLFGVAAAATIAVPVLSKTTVSIGPWRAAELALALGGIGTLLIVLRYLTETRNARYGLFLGIVAAGAIAYGTVMGFAAAGGELNPFAAVTGEPRPPGIDEWPEPTAPTTPRTTASSPHGRPTPPPPPPLASRQSETPPPPPPEAGR
jgi:hypothetical protein